MFLAGPPYRDEGTDPVPTSGRDSPTSTGRAEEDGEPEEKGEDSLTDDREEEDARSSCLSRDDSCDTGEAKVHVLRHDFKGKIVHTVLWPVREGVRQHACALHLKRFFRGNSARPKCKKCRCLFTTFRFVGLILFFFFFLDRSHQYQRSRL